MKSIFDRVLDTLLVLAAVAVAVVVVKNNWPGQQPPSGRFRTSATDSIWRAGRLVGTEAAAFHLVIWTDYECPACGQFEKAVDSLRGQMGDSLAISYQPFPLAVAHPRSLRAAKIAECAGRIGRFGETHAALFALDMPTHPQLAPDSVIGRLGLGDEPRFVACMADSATSSGLLTSFASAQKLGVTGTPTTMIGEKGEIGGMPAQILSDRIHKD